MTGHGFRALAMSPIKERLGYRHEVVDRQLALDLRLSISHISDHIGHDSGAMTRVLLMARLVIRRSLAIRIAHR